jgi:hypothetical protein
MLNRSRLIRWTVAEFRLWSTGIREGREMARRFNRLVRTPKSALNRRFVPSEFPTAN